MSTAPVILDFRLSLIWTETLLGLLDGSLKPRPSFEFLTSRDEYAQLFDDLQRPGYSGPFDVPWKEPREHFWNFYLPGSLGKPVGGKQAWKNLVPLRVKPALSLEKPPQAPPILEGFYYPHGMAVVCTFRCQGRFTPVEAQDIAYDVRENQRFTVTTGGKQEQLYLRRLAETVLDSLRAAAVEPADNQGQRRTYPFTILTVVKGEGVDAKVPIPDDEDPVRRMLDVLSYWPTDRVTSSLTALNDTMLTLKRGTSRGSAIFARERGRTIWLPGLFLQRKRQRPPLSRYHRNILMGAMQMESLTALLGALVGASMKPTNLSLASRSRIRSAAECLERVYGGDRTETYRSHSLRRQIVDNDLAALNQIRKAFRPGVADLRK